MEKKYNNHMHAEREKSYSLIKWIYCEFAVNLVYCEYSKSTVTQNFCKVHRSRTNHWIQEQKNVKSKWSDREKSDSLTTR